MLKTVRDTVYHTMEMAYRMKNQCRHNTVLDGLKEACIRWDPDPPCDGAIIRGHDHDMPSWEGTLAPPDEYDFAVRLRR